MVKYGTEPMQVKWQQVNSDVSTAISMPCYTLGCCSFPLLRIAGIDSFESNLQRLADGGEQVQDDVSHPLAGETPMEHIHNLRYTRHYNEWNVSSCDI